MTGAAPRRWPGPGSRPAAVALGGLTLLLVLGRLVYLAENTGWPVAMLRPGGPCASEACPLRGGRVRARP
jgi:hypothetical protein